MSSSYGFRYARYEAVVCAGFFIFWFVYFLLFFFFKCECDCSRLLVFQFHSSVFASFFASFTAEFSFLRRCLFKSWRNWLIDWFLNTIKSPEGNVHVQMFMWNIISVWSLASLFKLVYDLHITVIIIIIQ